MLSVRKGKSHHQPSYILEAFLWSRVIGETKWIDRYPTVRRVAWGSDFVLRRSILLHRCVMVLEQCYDFKIPFPIRLEAIGKVISSLNSLTTVDKELMVWGATLRWLGRGRSSGFYSLVMGEYKALSWRLTEGNSPDALGVFGDLLVRDKPTQIETTKAA